MSFFTAQELTFRQAFTPAPPDRSVRINADASATPLTSGDAQISAGSFAFEEPDQSASQLGSRFIIWRANGSTLLLEEHGAILNSRTYSVMVTFVRNRIIPGTKLLLSNGILNICVPTVSGLHRFFLRLPSDNPGEIQNPVLSGFPEGVEQLLVYHEEFILSTSSSSMPFQADCAVPKRSGDGRTTVVFAMTDGNLVAVQLQPFGHRRKSSDTRPVEVQLRHDGVMSRLMRTSRRTDGIISLVVASGRRDTFIYAAYRNAQFRIWSGETQKKCCDISLLSYCSAMPEKPVVQLVKIRLAAVPEEKRLFLVVHIQTDNTNSFLLLTPSSDRTELFKITEVEGPNNVELIDYAYLANRPLPILVALFRDSNKKTILMQKIVALSAVHREPWMTVGDNFPERDAEEYDPKSRLFDSDRYSFDAVQRALQLSCKQCVIKVPANDWTALEIAMESYLQSPQFEQQYTSRAERSALNLSHGTNEDDLKSIPLRKFWTLTMKSVEELHEELSQPMGLWKTADELGIFGVILQNRITVYHPVDFLLSRLDTVFTNVQLMISMVRRCFDEAMKFAAGRKSTEAEIVAFRDAFTFCHSAISEMVKHFVRLSPSEKTTTPGGVLLSTGDQHYGGDFTAGLLAAALRSAVHQRAALVERFSALIDLVEYRKMTSLNPRWETMLTKQKKPLKMLQRNYKVLEKILNDRVNWEAEAGKQNSGSGFTVAFAMFASGFFPKQLDPLSPTQNMEQMETATSSGEEAEVDEHQASQGQAVQQASSRFALFSDHTLSAMLLEIWPENAKLAIAKFLAREKYFEALMKYVEWNEPYPERLEFALRYYRAISLTGLNYAKQGLTCFMQALDGILNEDPVLNAALLDDEMDEGQLTPAIMRSTSQYFVKVMAFFEASNHTEQLVEAGKTALKLAKATDPELVFIHTALFKYEMTNEQWADALATVKANPSGESQRDCLRLFIARLLDYDNEEIRLLDVLVRADYGNLEELVLEILENRVNSMEMSDRAVEIYETLFAFHMHRSDFRKAAIAMYCLATRLGPDIGEIEALKQRVGALAAAEQCLSLLDSDDYRWIAVPQYTEPEIGDAEEFEMDHGRLTIQTPRLAYVTCDRLGKEFALANARLCLMASTHDDQKNVTDRASRPSKRQKSAPPPMEPVEVMALLVENHQYDMAVMLSRIFQLPVYTVLEALTMKCLTFDVRGLDWGKVEALVESNRWFNAVQKLPSKERGWAILKNYMTMMLQLEPQDTAILRTVANCFLSIGQLPPAWLSEMYKHQNFPDYARLLVDYGHIEAANDALVQHLEMVTNSIRSADSTTWLPYTVIDELLLLNGKAKVPCPSGRELKEKLEKYFERLNAFSVAGTHYRRTSSGMIS